MPTINEVKELLLEHFTVQWAERTRVSMDNEKFEPSDSFRDPWVVVKVRETNSRQSSMGKVGNRRFERTGVFRVEIATIDDKGSKANDGLMQDFRDIFEARRIGPVVMTVVNSKDVGVFGKWFKAVAEATYMYDEIK